MNIQHVEYKLLPDDHEIGTTIGRLGAKISEF